MKELDKFTKMLLILIAVLVCLLALSDIIHKDDYKRIEKKLDKIASETDATAERLDNLESDFKEYRTGTKEIIDSIYNQLNEHKDNMQEEIERIDTDVEEVKISKANKKTYTATAKTVYYPQNTDGLTASAGVNNYEGHRETYYNLNMSRVVSNAQNSGIDGEYWVRDDGAKMFGDYVIVAANQELYPYGSTVETSLGTGIVLDTGTFVNTYPEGYDLATDW